MNNAKQKGIFLETCLKESNGFVELTVFPNNKCRFAIAQRASTDSESSYRTQKARSWRG